MSDCIRKPSKYTISTKINSAFYPSCVGKSSVLLRIRQACLPVSSGK